VAAASALELELVGDALAGVDPRLRALQRAVAGPVYTPASTAYASLRSPYNLRVAGVRPLGLVQPLGAADVRATVLWARRNRVRLAARSGGHSYGGYSTTGGVVVDLRRLSAVSLNRPAGTVTIGAGARLFDVEQTLAARGVAVPTGSCPTVGLGGLALGGGVGFASRAWGTTSDNVASLKVVTADGHIRTCSPRENPGLYWACRGGGGGNFGVVTSFTMRVHPVSDVSWFAISWPWAQAAAVVAAWQAFAPAAPDGLFSICSLGTGAAGPHVQTFGQHLGTEAELRTLLAPLLRVDGARLSAGTQSYIDAQRRWAGCLGRSDADCRAFRPQAFAAKSDYVNRPLSSAGISALLGTIEAPAAGSILFDSYGGALNRPAAGATAFVHRDALGSLQYFASWTGDGAASRRWLRDAHAAMRPHVSGFAYQNYIDPELTDWQHAYYGSNLPRLRAVKKQADPDFFFRFAQAIPPK
jgi:FAD/FMN-containing dehydrogenase